MVSPEVPGTFKDLNICVGFFLQYVELHVDVEERYWKHYDREKEANYRASLLSATARMPRHSLLEQVTTKREVDYFSKVVHFKN